MNNSIKTTAIAILVSLGVVACSSGGGGGSSAPKADPEQAKQIEALKKQVEAEQQAVKSAQNNAKNSDKAKADAQTALANAQEAEKKAQQALKDAKDELNNAEAIAQTATENNQQLQREKEQAQKDLAQAQANLAKAEKSAEENNAKFQTEKAQAQTALEQAQKDLAQAQANLANAEKSAVENNQKLQAEKAQAQTALEQAQKDLEKAQKELQENQDALAYWDSTWRYFGGNNYERMGKSATIGRSTVKIDVSKLPVSDEVHQIPVLDGGKNVGTAYVINQKYSSYQQFMPKDVSLNAPRYSDNDFVFIPTDMNKADVIKNQLTATYTGKALDRNYNNDDDNSGSVTRADFTLTANFADNTVSGKITNREQGYNDITLEKTQISSQENEEIVALKEIITLLKAK